MHPQSKQTNELERSYSEGEELGQNRTRGKAMIEVKKSARAPVRPQSVHNSGVMLLSSVNLSGGFMRPQLRRAEHAVEAQGRRLHLFSASYSSVQK